MASNSKHSSLLLTRALFNAVHHVRNTFPFGRNAFNSGVKRSETHVEYDFQNDALRFAAMLVFFNLMPNGLLIRKE